MNYTRTISMNYKGPQTIIGLLTCLVVVSLCLYGVLVFSIVNRVAYRQKMQTSISQKTNHVAQLESEYIVLKNNVSPTTLADKGFVSTTNRSYITNHTLGLSLRPIE